MIWFAWRQFRFQAFVVFVFLVVVALFFVFTGPHLAHLYAGLNGCKANGDCESLTNSMLNEYNKYFPFVQALSLIFPLLLGIFWGAPLIAHELETGTYRLAWTQGVSRRRWVVTKFAVVGVASMVATGLLSWMLTWWASPIDTLNASRFSSLVFDTSYIAPIGYAAFAFALGVAAGVLWRRTLPAMATSIVAFVTTRVLFVHFVRPNLMSPLKQITSIAKARNFGFSQSQSGLSFIVGSPYRPNALVYDTTVVGKDGAHVTKNWLAIHCPGLNNPQAQGVGKGLSVRTGEPAPFTSCVHQISASFHEIVSYQPASRFWTFQWYEMTIYTVAALLLGGLSYWWVRRRIA